MVSRRRRPQTLKCPSCEKDHPVPFFIGKVCMYCSQAEDEAKAAAAKAAQVEEEQPKEENRKAVELQRLREAHRNSVIERKKEADERRRQIELARAEEEQRRKEFDKKEAAKAELAKRQAARRYLLPFVERFNPEYMAGWVHKDICRRLEKFSDDVASKKSPRLMLFMPPRHGKSELASKTFPAWHLGRHPTHEVIASSYSSALAMDFSRKVRDLLRDPSYGPIFKTELSKDSQSTERWNTTAGGGYVAAGVGGPITGRGAHCLIIDDPIKNAEDADSEVSRESLWNWYTSTAYTRLAPGGGVLIILTRWHDDDLAGRLLEAAKDGGDQWEVISYPARALEDELYRNKDEALHPDRYDEEALARIEKAVGSRVWNALYQQQPVADDGDYFTKQMIRYYKPKDLPHYSELKFFTAWDFAIGQKERNDYTVGVTIGMDKARNLYVVEVRRGRWNSKEIVGEILDCWDLWRSQITGMEKGHIEMALGPFLREEIDKRMQDDASFGSFFYEELKTGRRDKELRARPMQGMMQQGRVYFNEGDSMQMILINELLRFPNGTHDDCVDSLAWLGQMLQLFVAMRDANPARKKSWKDKLSQYAGVSKTGRTPMTA